MSNHDELTYIQLFVIVLLVLLVSITALVLHPGWFQ